MKMKYCFILNPAAGKGWGAEQVKEDIEACYKQTDTEVELYLTKGVGDATDYVIRTVDAAPEEAYRFYACGGDGTLSEVINGVMRLEHPERASVGLIPVGTGNDFVRNFTFGDKFFDVRAQLEAEPLAVDLIRCNDRYAINMVNIGFDCEVVVKTAQLKKSPLIPSKMEYIAGLIVTLFRKPGVKAKQSFDGGEEEDKRYLLNTYANGSYCGGGFYSNPKSSMRDGKLDSILVKDIGRLKFLSLVGKYKKGEHLGSEFESVLCNKKFSRVDMRFEKEIFVCVDGELMAAEELHLSVVPKALNFLVPTGSWLLQSEESAEQDTAREAVAEGAEVQ